MTTKRQSIWQEIENEDPLDTRQPCSILNTPTSRKHALEEPCGTSEDKTYSPLRKRPYESQEDQNDLAPTRKGTKEKLSVKRGLLPSGGNETSKGNKRKVTKNTGAKKSKAGKVEKGQKQLTCFFT